MIWYDMMILIKFKTSPGWSSIWNTSHYRKDFLNQLIPKSLLHTQGYYFGLQRVATPCFNPNCRILWSSLVSKWLDKSVKAEFGFVWMLLSLFFSLSKFCNCFWWRFLIFFSSFNTDCLIEIPYLMFLNRVFEDYRFSIEAGRSFSIDVYYGF